MRETKFRAWDKRRKVWVNEKQIGLNLLGELIAPDETWLEHGLGDLVLMQYTGLRDRNNREIFEGDILQIRSPDLTTEHLIGEVVWKFMSWLIKDGGMLDSFKNLHLEIIGNIYSNPELLEEK